MNYEVAEILKEIIAAENLPYVEVLAGLVQEETVKKKGKTPGTFVQKKYPIYCPLGEDCSPNNIKPLVPDNKLKSLFYFERNGSVIVTGRERGYTNFRADVFLTAWMNPRKLGLTDCDISAKVIAQLLDIFDRNAFNDAAKGMSKIIIKPISIRTKEKSIYSRWQYSDQFYQLIEYPYDTFQIRIQVEFAVHRNCIDDLQISNPVTC